MFKRNASQTGSRLSKIAALMLAAAATVSGCGFASAPISEGKRVVATPQPGELSIMTQSRPAVGDVVPVYVSVANGSDVPRAIVPSQVFAIDENGNRIAPLPPGEAARQAGSAGQLKAALTSAAASGVLGGAVGAAIGAGVGALVGSAGTGAAIGSGIGGGEGILQGAPAGQAAARNEANSQINALALQNEAVRKDFTVSGYVFFPKGQYKEVELLLVNSETGNTETIRQPWQ
jgi:hypothetical protein